MRMRSTRWQPSLSAILRRASPTTPTEYWRLSADSSSLAISDGKDQLPVLAPTAERRRVLVLDDPTSAFDAMNAAGFGATLRAFIRLARPEQVILTTHDDAVATQLAEELAPVGGWPAGVGRIRCRRNADDASVTVTETRSVDSGDLAEEEAMLGLGGEPTLFAHHPGET